MASFKKLLTASSALAIAAVGLNAPASQAVVRGKNADDPAVVKIWLQGEHDGTKVCTGTHVGNGWVLTAAHCGMHMHHKTLRVGWGDPRTGAYNPERGQTNADARTYGVEGTADRAEYPDDYRVDMMLIHSPELETAQVPAMPIRTEGTASAARHQNLHRIRLRRPDPRTSEAPQGWRAPQVHLGAYDLR